MLLLLFDILLAFSLSLQILFLDLFSFGPQFPLDYFIGIGFDLLQTKPFRFFYLFR